MLQYTDTYCSAALCADVVRVRKPAGQGGDGGERDEPAVLLRGATTSRCDALGENTKTRLFLPILSMKRWCRFAENRRMESTRWYTHDIFFLL